MHCTKTVMNIFAVLLGAGSMSGVLARTVEVTTTSCPGIEVTSSVEVAPQQMVAAFRLNGGIRTQPAGGIFDLMTAMCHGTLSTAGGKRMAMGNCVWVDKDGDKVVFQFHRTAPGPGRSEMIAGTGKFTGIRGANDYQVNPLPAMGASMNSCIDATWKLELP